MIMDYEKYIKTYFKYNKNGTLSRTDRKGGNGSLDKDGYLIIKVKGKQFKAHRIVWLLNNGNFPKNELDHKNRNRIDNRIENLRESNRKEQVHNSTIKPNKDTEVIGIYIDKTKSLKKKYCFHDKNNKTYRYYTLEDAIKNKKEKEIGLYEYL